MTDYRSQEHEIEIAAPPEAVWAALTEPDEMVKWYVEEASVEQREGGAYHVSWGEGMAGDGRIEVWDPPRHLCLVAESAVAPQLPDAPHTTEDYTLEVRGDRTVLRLVFSNLPASEDWDAFYEGTNLGWGAAFALMRYCLERQPGARATKAGAMGTTPITPAAVWERVVELLGGEPSGTYHVTTPLGDEWSGEVVLAHPPSGRFGNCALAVSVAELGGALFHVGAEQHGGSTLVYAGLVQFGDPDEAIAKAYRDLLTERLELRDMRAGG